MEETGFQDNRIREMEFTDGELQEVPVILAGVSLGIPEEEFEHSMKELQSLAKACGKKTVGIITQNMESPNQAFYVGSGKAEEIKELVSFQDAREVIFDDTLSPSQMRNLGKAIGVTVSDRTNLILDIFAMRAKTREAKIQVETARLQYMLPRLVGLREQLGRQGGASGSMSNKGAGETKLELDRRKIEHRISELRKELSVIQGNRDTMRKKREDSELLQVALVGYTNAGKSTILNRLVGQYGQKKEKTVLEKDMLFATLETTVRGLAFADHRDFLLADTVGFIHKLPHGLVEAFRSTLDEVKYADLLVQVVDYSDPDHGQHLAVTQKTLQEIGAAGIPQIIVYNKSDLAGMEELPKVREDRIWTAAASNVGMEELTVLIRDKLYADVKECSFLFPYDRGREASYVMERTKVLSSEYLEEGIRMRVLCKKPLLEKFQGFAWQGQRDG